MNEELVECRSEGRYAERPLAFYWEGQRQKVTDILVQWRSPTGMNFRVRTKTDNVYDLCYDEAQDRWTVIQIS
jgi:hypothetical protein